MFNVTVIKLRDIIKYLVSLIIIITVIVGFTRCFSNTRNNRKKLNLIDNLKANLTNYILYPIQEELQVIKAINEEEKNDIYLEEELFDENNDNADAEFTKYMLNTALKLQLSAVKAKEIQVTNNKVVDETNEGNKKIFKEKEEIELASKEEKTNIVTQNPIKETYTYKYNGIKIKNETDFKLTESILDPKNLKINNKNVLIFHTHTCESYTQSEGYEYKASGNFRTTDLNYSVARVGDSLKTYLEKYNFKVIHDKTYHDYPAYSGSYNRSLITAKNLLNKNKSDIIIDLHRDAIGSNSKYAPTVKIGNDYCAQLMFVIGTNRWGIRS